MRLNAAIAQRMGISRRQADQLISAGNITVNGKHASFGQQVASADSITIDGKVLPVAQAHKTILFHKPVGYVSSRKQQGSAQTMYALLPKEFYDLKPAGRLDKDSSGLMLLSSDGQLIYRLTHPSFEKIKTYSIMLDQPLTDAGRDKIESGVDLSDGISKLQLKGSGKHWEVRMHEGRNRQIRRTFDAIGYRVEKLHRVSLGDYQLPKGLQPGEYTVVK